MIALAASGLAVVLYAFEAVFLTIKIVGAAYLLWIAFNLWRIFGARKQVLFLSSKILATD